MVLYLTTKIILLNTTYDITSLCLLAKLMNNYYDILDAIMISYKFFDIFDLKVIIIDINSSIIYPILEKSIFEFNLL